MHDSYKSYHLTGPLTTSLCPQVSLVRCKFTNCHANEMQSNYVILQIITLSQKYHPFTASTNRMNLKANPPFYHSYKLKHPQHDFHDLNKWCVLDNPLISWHETINNIIDPLDMQVLLFVCFECTLVL